MFCITEQHHSYITITVLYFTHILLFSLPVCAVLFTVLKRGKAKKGKNDLIGAEEGEDPFADISSVGKSYIFLSGGHQQITSDLHMLSVHRVDLYNKSHHKSLSSTMNITISDSLVSIYQISMPCHLDTVKHFV